MVDQWQHLDDWEVDIIIGKGHRSALVSPMERRSKSLLLKQVDRRQADLVSQAILSLLEPFADLVHTITGDNGKDSANQETITQLLKPDFLFAHPDAAWERCSNEKMNGLIRQYCPKDTDF